MRTRRRRDPRTRRDLEVGRSVYTPRGLKIHRYRDHLRVTDMTNAGKRGKRVHELVVNPMYTLREYQSERVLRQAYAAIAPLGYAEARQKLARLASEYKLFRIEESSRRGVDVEPMATAIALKHAYNGSTVEIRATPYEFLVRHSQRIHAPGKTAHGFLQDTSYWQASKQDGARFYAWARQHLSRLSRITMPELRAVWDSLGVRYDSH